MTEEEQILPQPRKATNLSEDALQTMVANLTDELAALNVSLADYFSHISAKSIPGAQNMNSTNATNSGGGGGGGTEDGGWGTKGEGEGVEISEGVVWTLVAPLILLGTLVVVGIIAFCIWRLRDQRCPSNDESGDEDSGAEGQVGPTTAEMEMQEIHANFLRASPGHAPGHGGHQFWTPSEANGYPIRAHRDGIADRRAGWSPTVHHPACFPLGGEDKVPKEIHLENKTQGGPVTTSEKMNPLIGCGVLHKPSAEDLARLKLTGVVSQDGRVWLSEETGLQGGGRGGEGKGVQYEYCGSCQLHAPHDFRPQTPPLHDSQGLHPPHHHLTPHPHGKQQQQRYHSKDVQQTQCARCAPQHVEQALQQQHPHQRHPYHPHRHPHALVSKSHDAHLHLTHHGPGDHPHPSHPYPHPLPDPLTVSHSVEDHLHVLPHPHHPHHPPFQSAVDARAYTIPGRVFQGQMHITRIDSKDHRTHHEEASHGHRPHRRPSKHDQSPHPHHPHHHDDDDKDLQPPGRHHHHPTYIRGSRRGVENPIFTAEHDDVFEPLPLDSEAEVSRRFNGGPRQMEEGVGRGRRGQEEEDEEEEEEERERRGRHIINSTSMLSSSDGAQLTKRPPLTQKPIPIGGPDVSSIKLLNSTSQAWRKSRCLLPSTLSSNETPSYNSNINSNSNSNSNSNNPINDQSDEGAETLSLPSSISRFHASRVQFPPLMPDAAYPLTSTKALFSPSLAFHHSKGEDQATSTRGGAGGELDTLDHFSDNTSLQPNVGSSVTSGQVSDARRSHTVSSTASDPWLVARQRTDSSSGQRAASLPGQRRGAVAGHRDGHGSATSSISGGFSDDASEDRIRRQHSKHPNKASGKSLPSSEDYQGTDAYQVRGKQRRSKRSGKPNPSSEDDLSNNAHKAEAQEDDNDDSDFADPYVRALIGSKNSEPTSPEFPISASELRHAKNRKKSEVQNKRSSGSGKRQGFFLLPKQGGKSCHIYKYHRAPQVPTEETEATSASRTVMSPSGKKHHSRERRRSHASQVEEHVEQEAEDVPHPSSPASSPDHSTAELLGEENRPKSFLSESRKPPSGRKKRRHENERHPHKLYSCRSQENTPSAHRHVESNSGLYHRRHHPGENEDGASCPEDRNKDAVYNIQPQRQSFQDAQHTRKERQNGDTQRQNSPTTNPLVDIASYQTTATPFSSPSVNVQHKDAERKRDQQQAAEAASRAIRPLRVTQKPGKNHEDYAYVNMGGSFSDDIHRGERGTGANLGSASSGINAAGLVRDANDFRNPVDRVPGKPSQQRDFARSGGTNQQRPLGGKGTAAHYGSQPGSKAGTTAGHVGARARPRGDNYKEHAHPSNNDQSATPRALSTTRTDSEILTEVMNSFPQNIFTSTTNNNDNPTNNDQLRLPLYTDVTIPTAFADELFGIWSMSPEADDVSPSQPRTPLMTPLKDEAKKANSKFIWGNSGSPSASNSTSSFARGGSNYEEGNRNRVGARRRVWDQQKAVGDEDYTEMAHTNHGNNLSSSGGGQQQSSSAQMSVSDPASSGGVPPTPTTLGGELFDLNSGADDLGVGSNYRGLPLNNLNLSHRYVISGDPENDDFNNNDNINNNPDYTSNNLEVNVTSASTLKVVPTGNSRGLDREGNVTPTAAAVVLRQEKYWL